MTGARPEARGCPRAWEAEAARDGRLRAKDVDSLRRHLLGCEVCQRRHAQLNALGAVLRNLPPVPEDLLAARRTRHRLFAEADRLVLQSSDRLPRRRWIIGGSVVFAAAAAVVLALRVKGWAPSHVVPVAAAPVVVSPLQVDVQAQEGAIWHRAQVGSQVRLDLEAGEIRASVGARRPGASLVIRLPDGEIEDLGTVLTVRVEQGRTTKVQVFEGRVRLRLAGNNAVELGAGDDWGVPPQATPEPEPSCSTGAPRAATKPQTSASSTRQERRAERPTESPRKQEPTPSIEAATNPQQAREEDEAYLHIVELVRAHQLVEARTAARDYLLRFPKGFRREEVLGVATSVGH